MWEFEWAHVGLIGIGVGLGMVWLGFMFRMLGWVLVWLGFMFKWGLGLDLV